MADHDSEPKRTRSPLSSQGVMELLDRWVTTLEQEPPASTPRAEAPRPRNRAVRSEPPSAPFTDTRAEEAPPAEPRATEPRPERPRPEARPREPSQEKDPADTARAAREEIRLQGSVALVPPGEAQVVLGRENGKLLHRGTVGVRGPCAPTQAELLRLGLTEAQARALEFVLAWFAAPFDHVSWDSHAGEGPRWGTWPLSGNGLIEALARWKRKEPSAFAARLGRLGIDATLGQPSTLTVMDVEHGHPVEGRKALPLLGEDVRLLAALAQAGRERGAQLAQLEYITEQLLHPALALASEGEAPLDSPDGPFSTPRALALLFHAELRLGRRSVARLVAHAQEPAKGSGAGEHAGQRLAASLQSAGRTKEAAEVRRILSSPELAGAPA
ncbi:hypothetical protein [Hyalangium rubrum]|uniref:Uncharacterized protein n=1 Tax=Hyalangium rubrum TaxID=3103134 RepID=A0ABU5HCY8_9BACT|nr:hypothetical protein [Hyalangium sp. s54d21]MDY7231335.1 hypothetical protein [Hyalangium sp. s54d21]